jgi:glycosyltransferase involved in cell wall biosynthesis
MPGADQVYAHTARSRHYSQATRILFAATWRKNKGIEDLVPAFIELATRHSQLELSVVGASVPPTVVYAQFPENLRRRVVCDTPADDGAMAMAFARADLFVLPSLFEGTPLTLMQAMMSGLPIVTTSTCGMKDVIEDGKTGLLVPIRSAAAVVAAVERLVRSSTLRRELGTAVRRTALGRYTWDNAAVPVLRAYEALR